MEENIFISIHNKLQNEKLPVTYSWVQQKFNISPNESQIFLKKYLSQNKDVIATYLNHCVSDSANDVLSQSNFHSENNLIISLKLNRDIVDLKSFNWINESLRKLPIICQEACLIREEPNYEAESTTSKIEKKTEKLVSNNLKTILSEVNPKTIISPKKDALKSKKNILNMFQISNKSIKTKTEFKEASSTGPIEQNILKTNDPIDVNSNFKLPDDRIKVTNNNKVASDISSDFDISDNDFSEVSTSLQPSIVDHVAVNSPKKSTVTGILPKKSRLFENFEESSNSDCSPKAVKKQRRRLICESDGDSDSDKILVDSSFHEPKDNCPKQSRPIKPSRKTEANYSSKSIKNETKKRTNKTNEIKNITSEDKTVSKKSKLEHEDCSSSIDQLTLVNLGPSKVKKSKITEENSESKSMKWVEKTFLDDDGFLVVDKVRESVSIANKPADSPSIPEVITKLPSKSSTITKQEKVSSRKQSKTAVATGKQTNIMSFFQKKN